MNKCCLLAIFENEFTFSLKFNIVHDCWNMMEIGGKIKKLARKETCMKSLLTCRICHSQATSRDVKMGPRVKGDPKITLLA